MVSWALSPSPETGVAPSKVCRLYGMDSAYLLSRTSLGGEDYRKGSAPLTSGTF
jgi:hypothetical protein